MKLAFRSVLLLLLSGLGWVAYQRNTEPHLGAPPAPLKSAFQSEEEWMVGEIVRDIAEMSQFARVSRFDPSSVRAMVTRSAAPEGAWTATAALAAGTPVSVDLPLRTGVWSPAEYEPLARALAERPGNKQAPSSDEGLLASLRDLRAAVIERDNQRISKRLEREMGSSDAHEEAALLLGAFALREAAGWFTDHRQLLCRMTAHLAMAEALRGSPERSLSGRYAQATLLVLSRRTADGLSLLDGLDRQAAGSLNQAAWSRALRLRATNDWRALDQPQSRSLIERLEYYRSLLETSVDASAQSFVVEKRLEPVADWGRITTARNASGAQGNTSVPEGNQFFPGALEREEAEIAEVRTAAGAPPLARAGLVEALNEPAGRCLTSAGPRVIGWGTWAAFFQRHIAEHVHRVDLYIRRGLGLEDDADATGRRLDRDWGGLLLFPMASCYRIRGAEQNFDRIQDAIDVALTRPELMGAFNWTHLASGTRYEVLERGMARADAWFTTGLPRGTVYDSFWRLERLTTTRARTAGVLEGLAAIDPYNPDVARRRAEALARRKAPSAEILKAWGPRADYDLRALSEVSGALEKRPQEQQAILERLCGIDAEHCLALGDNLVDRGLDDQAAASFQRAIDAPSVDRVAASHSAPWLARYYREHGQREKALQIARQASETGSAPGLLAMGQHLEAIERFGEAEDYFVSESDRYKEPKYDSTPDLVSFLYRMARVRKLPGYESKLQRSLGRMFPHGLERIEPKTLQGQPTDGAFVNGHNDATLKQGLWAGDVIVGLDGWRVRNTYQYAAVNRFGAVEVPEMTFTIWRGGTYRELHATFPHRWLYVRLDDYPLKGWVEK